MSQILEINSQIKQETPNLIENINEQNEQIKQTQKISKQQVNINIVKQKLQVQVLAKSQLQNPQHEQNKQQQSVQGNTQYGPFSQMKQRQQIKLQKVTQQLNYEVNIQPILSNKSKQLNNKLSPNKNIKIKKQNKKSSCILTQQSIHESAIATKQQLQRQILELAKNIRKKVWKKQLIKSPNIFQTSNNNNSSILSTKVQNKKIQNKKIQNKKTQNKQIDNKLKLIYQKRQSLFQKYSYPRSNHVDINQLQKQQQKLKLGKYALSRIYHQQLIQQSNQNIQIISQHIHPQTVHHQKQTIQNAQSSNRSSYSRTQDAHKTRKQSMLPKLKLNFDKTHHKYKVTQFRRSILRQNKQRQIAKSLILKQKQDVLNKRRQIYNNSRYNPVGIKLSSLRASKLIDKQLLQKELLSQRIMINNKQQQNSNNRQQQNNNKQEQNNKQQQNNKDKINYNQQSTQKINNNNIQQHIINNKQMKQNNQNQNSKENQHNNIQKDKVVNASQAKSSLTFNFSFSDPINKSQLKTQSQLYHQVDNLTKMLENDSSPQSKIYKINQQQQQKQLLQKQKFNKTNNNNGIKQKKLQKQPKKWQIIDKNMTQSKTIDQIQRLHNSSYDEQNQQNQQDKNISLQYSYV